MNTSRLMQLAGVLMLSATLVACGAKRTAGGPATVEERGIGADEMSEMDRARAQGQGAEDQFGASALDDPTGVLSQRVVYFDYDSDAVREEYRGVIEAHAAFLAANPNRTVTLEGHADERGSREYNLALGERRALSVRRQMVLLGASAGQVRTVSYGEERPVADGHDEQSYQVNRRVELVY